MRTTRSPRCAAPSGDLAKMALDAGLVTGARGPVPSVEERLAEITGEDEDTHSYKGVDHWSYLANVHSQEALDEPSRATRSPSSSPSGEIVPGEQPPGMIGSDTLAQQLRDARFDDAVKAVVLRIDSPGGSTFASEVIRREVDGAAEAGKAGGRLDEQPRGLGRLLHRDGRRPHRREPGDAHRLDRHLRDVPDVPAHAREARRARRRCRHDGAVRRVPARPADGRCRRREILQQSIEHEYQEFIEHVAKSRKQDVAAIDAIAQGRVWSGADAKRLGLVDELGSYQDAIEARGEARQARQGLRRRVLRTGPRLRRGARPARAGGRCAHRRAAAAARPSWRRCCRAALRAGRWPSCNASSGLRDPRNVYAYCLACSPD